MNRQGLPGISTARAAELRNLLWSGAAKQLKPTGVILDGSLARDPLNTAYLSTLRCGLLLGKITATGLYAPSVLGVSTAAIASTGTSLTVSAATGVEIVRRLGASGTFNLVGPAIASGVVKKQTLTYSGVSGTAVTVTAPGLTASSCVQVWTPNAAWTAGTMTFGFRNPVTGVLRWLTFTYTTDLAGTLAAINVILDAAFGTGAIVATGGGNITSVTFTFTAGVWMSVPIETIKVIYTGATGAASTTTLTNVGGYSNGFVTGSLIMPVDGSEAPLGIQGKEGGIRVTDDDASDIDVTLDELIVAGMVDTSQIINVPADASTLAWLKAQLRLNGGSWFFDDDF
jgi:hypothetical protein